MKAGAESQFASDQRVMAAGEFFFRYRNAIFPTVFVATVLLAAPSASVRWPSFDFALTVMGLSIAALGQLFRLLVIGLSYIERGGRGGSVYASSLVTSGLYAHCRNPMYFGNGLIALGFILSLGSLTACVVLIPFFAFVYYAIVVAEEQYLKGRFQEEYAVYQAEVPRFIPRLRGIRKTFSQFRFDWRKAVRKEYGTAYATLAGMMVILQLKSSYRDSEQFVVRSLLSSHTLICGLLLLSAYAVTRTLKKRKLL